MKHVSVLGHGGFRKLAYLEWGSESATRTIICVHGVSRSGRDFDALASVLAKENRVIVPDLPGRGRSDWLASATHYTDRAYMGAMSALIARLDVEQVDWVGTSLGGHIGMMLAAQHATPIRRLVLNDFGARVSSVALRRIGGYLNRQWHFDSFEELEVHLRDALAPFGKLSDVEWRHLATHSAVPDEQGGWRFHYDPAIGHRFSVPMWLDVVLWPLWEEIDCPVLVLRGEHSDLLSAQTVLSMLERGPAAKAGKVTAVEFADCGHAPALMDPHQVSVVREFLAEPSGTRIPRSASSRRLRATLTQASLS